MWILSFLFLNYWKPQLWSPGIQGGGRDLFCKVAQKKVFGWLPKISERNRKKLLLFVDQKTLQTILNVTYFKSCKIWQDFATTVSILNHIRPLPPSHPPQAITQVRLWRVTKMMKMKYWSHQATKFEYQGPDSISVIYLSKSSFHFEPKVCRLSVLTRTQAVSIQSFSKRSQG